MELFAQGDAEEFVKTGAREFHYHRGICITPGAKDVLTSANIKLIFDAQAKSSQHESSAKPHTSKAKGNPKLFHSSEVQKIKEQICEIGHRMWLRGYCHGHAGTISARLDQDTFLVTPAETSKGFMKPEMICLVNAAGKQLAGTWRPSDEFGTHAAIYSVTSEAHSICHANPPHVGAFAIKELPPPPRLSPELEIFVGQIAVAKYQTPGSPEMAEAIKGLAPKHQAILMGCHGVICQGRSVEDAYLKVELAEAYCQRVLLAQVLPGSPSIPCEKFQDLLEIKKTMGLPDSRFELKNAELCEVDPWAQMCGQSGCSSPVPSHNPNVQVTLETSTELEFLVQKLTDEILSNLSK